MNIIMKNIFLTIIFICTIALSLSLAAQNKKQDKITIVIPKGAQVDIINQQQEPAQKTEKSVTEKPVIVPEPSNILINLWESGKKGIRKYLKYDKMSLWDIGYLFMGILLTLIVGRMTRWFLENHAKKLASKTKTQIDDLIFNAIGRPTSLVIFSAGLYISAWPLTSLMSPIMKEIFGRVCLALGAAAIAWGIYRLVGVIDYILKKLAEKTTNNLDDLIVGVIRKSLKITIVVVSILFIGQNILNLNITTLLAGAGVMGLAIAFAAQDTIANFFGSIMIILDQPFKVGDCISVSGYKGSVENVGFRSTRIRTFDGHLVSLPNKALANADIENIAKRPFIKHTINLGLTYDTGYKQMEKAVKLLHELLDKQECMDPERLPRIVFDKFNDFSLNISVTVWWHFKNEEGEFDIPDYGVFMKWVHKTDMDILRIFDKEGLEFAFPTNTTYLAYDDKRQVKIEVEKK